MTAITKESEPKEIQSKPIVLPAQTMHELVEILAKTNPKTVVEKVTFGVPSLHRNLMALILDVNKGYVEKQKKFDEVRKEFGERYQTIMQDIDKLRDEKLKEEEEKLVAEGNVLGEKRKNEINAEAEAEKKRSGLEVDGELVKKLKEEHEIEFFAVPLVIGKDQEIIRFGDLRRAKEGEPPLEDEDPKEFKSSQRLIIKDETPVTLNLQRKSYLFLRSAVNENGRKFGIFLSSKDEDAVSEVLQIDVEE